VVDHEGLDRVAEARGRLLKGWHRPQLQGEIAEVDHEVVRAAALAAIGVDHLIFVTNGPWQSGGDLDVVLEAVAPVASIAA
jgi:hypothetical protein